MLCSCVYVARAKSIGCYRTRYIWSPAIAAHKKPESRRGPARFVVVSSPRYENHNINIMALIEISDENNNIIDFEMFEKTILSLVVLGRLELRLRLYYIF